MLKYRLHSGSTLELPLNQTSGRIQYFTKLILLIKCGQPLAVDSVANVLIEDFSESGAHDERDRRHGDLFESIETMAYPRSVRVNSNYSVSPLDCGLNGEFNGQIHSDCRMQIGIFSNFLNAEMRLLDLVDQMRERAEEDNSSPRELAIRLGFHARIAFTG